ncbi:phosphatidate cytidylyltransferase [Chloroflexota bacterium]
MLKQRVITALWGIPLLIAAIWFDQPIPCFTVLVAVWGLLAAFEFYKITKATQIPLLTCLGLVWTLLFILSPHCSYAPLVPLLVTSAVVLSLIFILRYPQKEGAFLGWAWTIAGIFYVGWLLSYLVALRGLDGGRDWVLLALLITFGSDTMAYFTGRALGKHRLAPRISPGKTWEGAIGGIVGGIAISLLLTYSLNLPLSYWGTAILGLLVSVFGQLGDLVESLLKRNAGVKDSGNLIPGHGGFLDRIDSVVFAGVVVYYYVLSLNAGWLDWLT